MLFVHRDADSSQESSSAGPERRYDEVARAVADASYDGAWVGIVPVRMTEAWLLLDESAIRRVAGRPHGDEPLDPRSLTKSKTNQTLKAGWLRH